MSIRKEIIRKLGEGKPVKAIIEELKDTYYKQEAYQGEVKKLRRYIYIVRHGIEKEKAKLQQKAEISTTIKEGEENTSPTSSEGETNVPQE